MKILIIRLSSIGDIVLTFPVVTALKNFYQNVEIHYLTKKKFVDTLIHHPKIYKIWTYESNLNQLIKDLKKENFNIIFDLHNNLRSFWITLRLGVPTRRFHKENWNKWKIVYLKSKIKIPHVVDRYLKTLNFETKDNIALEYYCGDPSQQDAFSILSEYDIKQKYVAIVLSATHFTKKWLKEYFVELIQNMELPVVLLGGKTEIEEGQWIENKMIKPKCTNLCGKTNLNVSAAILKHAELVITHDTGLMHIACAYQKKMIVLWGNTCPELGFSPYQNTNAINLSLNLPCKPCSKLGMDYCPQKHFFCMKKLTPKWVLENYKLLINR